MSSPVPLVFTILALTACQGHSATLVPTSTFLKETINMLSNILQTEVSCGRRNVTNVFAGNKTGNDTEILCKASTVVWEVQSCHRFLKGIYYNLLSLVQRKSTVPRAPCPVAAGDPTSLHHFLGDLHRLLQQTAKNGLASRK